MQLLTEAEIAELREEADGMGWMETSENGQLVVRLLDEVTRSRALLKRIEWSATGRRCPVCNGLATEWAAGDTIEVKSEEERFGHGSNCELDALIGGP